ncbi:MAG: TonB family protein [Acidobacteriota bacterium]|nr:TonB family protein [Acidobacteriota bacterium]
MIIPFLALMTSFLILPNAGSLSGAVVGNNFRAAQQTNTPESPELAEARALSNSAVKLHNEGKFKEALEPAKRALKLREKTLAGDDKRVADALGNLAVIYLALGKYQEAETFYERVLVAEEKRSGVESLQVAKTLDVLAWLHYARGEVKQSTAEYKRVLAIKEKASGPRSGEVARTLFRLAEIYQTQGALQEAEPFYRRLIEFDDKVQLEADITVNDARQRFICLLRKMNKIDEADRVLYRGKTKENPELITGPKNGPTFLSEGGILNGKALKLPKPEYPEQARAAGITGTVVVQVAINEQGKVVRACALRGHELLWLTSERAAYTSEFAPTKLNGVPVKITGVITYNFLRR